MKDISAEIACVARHYKYVDVPPFLITIQQLIKQLLHLIADLLKAIHITMPGLSDTRAAGTAMQYLLYAAGAAGAVLIILAWLRLAAHKSLKQKAGQEALLAGKVLDAQGWRAYGEAQCQQGNWQQACRALYHCFLQTLDEKEIARLAPSRSNYEYYYALANYPALQKCFRQLFLLVETIWFGNRQASRQDYEQCLALLSEAEGEISQLAAAGGKTT